MKIKLLACLLTTGTFPAGTEQKICMQTHLASSQLSYCRAYGLQQLAPPCVTLLDTSLSAACYYCVLGSGMLHSLSADALQHMENATEHVHVVYHVRGEYHVGVLGFQRANSTPCLGSHQSLEMTLPLQCFSPLLTQASSSFT